MEEHDHLSILCRSLPDQNPGSDSAAGQRSRGSLIFDLQERYPEMTMFYNHLLAEALNVHWQMKQVLHQYTASQRCQWFLETYPGLFERVSSKNAASFLGMLPVTMSQTIREQQALPDYIDGTTTKT